jgi:hypothetical protein
MSTVSGINQSGMKRIPFRKLPPSDIHSFHCPTRSSRKHVFETRFKPVDCMVVVREEETVCVDRVPCGIVYIKNGNAYAIGVIESVGTFNLDELFTMDIHRPVVFQLWGSYQSVIWTAGEIEELLNWRQSLIEQPHRVDSRLVEKFEKSRWMLFCFWPNTVEDLIELEIKIMGIVLEQDMLGGGVMRLELPRQFDVSTMDEVREIVKKQYMDTKLLLTEEEEDFVTNEAWFSEQIKQIFNL